MPLKAPTLQMLLWRSRLRRLMSGVLLEEMPAIGIAGVGIGRGTGSDRVAKEAGLASKIEVG